VISQEYSSVDKFCYGILSSNVNTFQYYLSYLLLCTSSTWICMELLTVTHLHLPHLQIWFRLSIQTFTS